LKNRFIKLITTTMSEKKKKVYLETYGCQMNVADSELVMGLLDKDGYDFTNSINDADVVMVNTCSVRENAEQRVYGRLGEFKALKTKRPEVVVGVIGCMAERLRDRLTDEKAQGVGQIVDVIVGPDEYRKVPSLINKAWHGEKGIAVRLSRVETYDDLEPLRTEGLQAWISVMRGCDKFCTFCVVPFTRGRERSRTLENIVHEVEALASRGFREVTLLGQNVNSYRDNDFDFADLMGSVAEVDPRMRVRFTTSHPQDMSDKLIEVIAMYPNICKFIHLPIQSGSDRILELMNRTYDRKHYMRLVHKIMKAIPNVSLSTDVIAGFPTETEEDHRETLALMNEVRFDGAYMFTYSPRENTPAFSMVDDVPADVKSRRITEIVENQNRIALERNKTLVGTSLEVLVEGESKKSSEQWQGRTDGNKIVIFPKGNFSIGDFINVNIVRVNSATLFGELQSSQQAYKEEQISAVA